MTLKSFSHQRLMAVIGAVLLLVGYAGGASAQTFTHNTTTLSAAQTATDTTAVLTSASAASGSSFGAVQVGQYIFVDGEMEFITAISSTTATVQRRGRQTSHAAGAPVFIGAPGSFQGADPPAGSCTTASQPKFWISQNTGNIFTCGTDSKWNKAQGPYFSAGSGSGATVTLTAADAGKTFLFDRAAGIIYTLPPPVPGMTFDFVYTVTITSNAAVVVTNSASVFVAGATHIVVTGAITGLDFQCNGTTHVKISSNGGTSGGVLGGHVRFVAVSSTVWVVDGLLVGTGASATPCST